MTLWLRSSLILEYQRTEVMNLSKVIFWETNYAKIDWDNKVRYVVERVLMYGTVEDWRTIQQYYGMDRTPAYCWFTFCHSCFIRWWEKPGYRRIFIPARWDF